ncbi:hypothetical protein QJQ45_028914 [Haematococcus lacustris]|nr:hypothetical protein QJQ45_028914 [Haematococcus lacustris]
MASGEVRAARVWDNPFHARKCKLAQLPEHLPQELWDTFLADVVQPRVKACSERAVLGSRLLGFVVRNLFTQHAADKLNAQGQPQTLCRHISASSFEHSNLRALAVTHAAAFAKASTPVADLVRPASRAAAPASPATLAADLVQPATPAAAPARPTTPTADFVGPTTHPSLLALPSSLLLLSPLLLLSLLVLALLLLALLLVSHTNRACHETCRFGWEEEAC